MRARCSSVGSMQAARGIEACSISFEVNYCGVLGLLPSPPELGLARVRHFRWPKSGKPDFGWGGVGGGGRACEAPLVRHRTTPLPTPPPQGGREQTEFAARVHHLRLPYSSPLAR